MDALDAMIGIHAKLNYLRAQAIFFGSTKIIDETSFR